MGQTEYKLHSTKTDGSEVTALSSDGRLLAFARRVDTMITLWDVEKDVQISTIKQHKAGIRALAFSPDGKQLVAASGFLVDLVPKKAVGELLVFDVKQGSLVKSLSAMLHDFKSVTISPNGRLVATTSRDGVVRAWDISSKELKAFRDGSAAAFAPNNLLAISSDDEGGCTLYDCEKQQTVRKFKIGNQRINAMAFSPDGNRLAAAEVDAVVRVWDLKNCRLLAELKGHAEFIWAISLSRDGKLLATAGRDKSVRLWDTTTFKEIARLNGHDEDVMSVLVVGTGDTIISSSQNGVMKFWRKVDKNDKPK